MRSSLQRLHMAMLLVSTVATLDGTLVIYRPWGRCQINRLTFNGWQDNFMVRSTSWWRRWGPTGLCINAGGWVRVALLYMMRCSSTIWWLILYPRSVIDGQQLRSLAHEYKGRHGYSSESSSAVD